VVHDTGGGGQDHVSELTGGQELDDPLLEIAETNIVAGGNDTGLVETIIFISILWILAKGKIFYRPLS